MTYNKRLDGRKFDEMREVSAKAGVIKRADGSGWFKMGNTEAYAAVYGPRNLHPRFLQDPQKGVLRVFYNMMPFSSLGDRVRPGKSRRSREISLVSEKAISPVLDLSEFPNSVVDIFIELPQTDAGTRCAGINAAAIALADAGFSMKDMVSSLAVGCIDGTVIADLMYDEEAFEGDVADIPVAVLPNSGKISLLQMDGKLSKENLKDAIEMAKKLSLQIYEVQKNALKDKYKEEVQK